MRGKTGRPAASIDLRRASLLVTASLTAVVAGLSAVPANAQLARLRAGDVTVPQVGAPRGAGDSRSASMREALIRQQSAEARAAEMRTYVTAARQAATVVAARARPTDGLSERGLNPIAEVREAIRLAAGSAAEKAAADAIVAGLGAALDPTGTRTWDGAGLPTQTVAGAETTVTITQTQSRAVLSWNRFDVGANTTVQFDQKVAGTAQPGWIAVNRVVDSADPTTILGKVKADGAVYILNPRGVIFGKGAQLNLHSLLASSLDLGNLGRDFVSAGPAVSTYSPATIRDRNISFLDNGPFASGVTNFATIPPLLLSPILADGRYRTDQPIVAPVLGSVVVDPGATVTARTGGSIILAGPLVDNAGVLSAVDGQVSLQGGHLITFAQSTGSATSFDPDVRGVILRTVTGSRFPEPEPALPRPQDGIVVNTGLIESRRGYISLGAGVYGEVVNQGLLTATTSVTRNAKIAINAGKITIGGAARAAEAGGIVIMPDANGETIPQGTAIEPPNFKTSKIEIGGRGTEFEAPLDRLGRLQPSEVIFGDNALLFAPSADVTIGAPIAPGELLELRRGTGVSIGANAIIDVSGLKDVEVDVARNIIEITPVKRNELRDTPNYREVAVDDRFTLNGTTLFVDVRRSGVREDGVRWVGSPLIEAGSLASQIQITAAELMTEGGNIVVANSSAAFLANPTAENATLFRVAAGARIDFSGGWIRYTEAQVPTSQLITTDGRVVDIAAADPNDGFIGIRNGFTEQQPRFGVISQFDNPISIGTRFEAGYDEGSDAGSLAIATTVATIDGALFGNAHAGERQRAGGAAATLASTLAGDPRKLQRGPEELPVGGYLSISPSSSEVPLGGDIIIYKGARGSGAAAATETLLNDAMLSAAGLSALSLRTSGSIVVAGAGQALLQPAGAYSLTGDASLSLAPGGRLDLRAGRGIRFDGDVSTPGGTIIAETRLLESPVAGRAVSFRDEIGSIFRVDDDIVSLYADRDDAPSPFDIVVNGKLSAAGRWTNDSGDAVFEGGGWIDGGSISLTTAPRIFAAIGGSIAGAIEAADLSGSIIVGDGALLDVSAGGYVSRDGRLDLSGRGGDVALVNETVFAAIALTQRVESTGDSGASDTPIGGTNQTVDFTPIAAEGEAQAVLPQIVPSALRSRVSVADGSLKGFGFEGGGTFRLVSPDIAFGSAAASPAATAIPLDFLVKTGFGTLDLTSNRSQILFDIFSNERAGYSAFAATTTFRVGAGETLDLSQTLYSAFPVAADAQRLLALSTGGEVSSVLAPVKPAAAFDQRGATLVLGGLSELVVEAGGNITGAAEAAIVTPKLVNLGSIVLPGGTITQRVASAAESALARAPIAVRDLAEVFGPSDATGRFDENFVGPAGITSRDLVSSEGDDRLIVLTGEGDFDTGIELAAGSVTDLSGAAFFDPRSPFFGTQPLRLGRVIGGGSIGTSVIASGGGTLVKRFVAAPGARLDLDGAIATFDQVTGGSRVDPVDAWSSAGTLRIAGGGSIAGASVSAFGGAPQAFGGTLDIGGIAILGAGGDPGDADVILDRQIEASGFDSMLVRGRLDFIGDVDLDLARSLIVSAVTLPNGRPADTGSSDIIVSASAGSDVRVAARYIRFQSQIDRADASRAGTGTGDAEVTFNAGALGFDLVGAALFDASIGTTRFESKGDFRLTGVDPAPAINIQAPQPVLNGELIASHDLVFDVGRIFATTGTGNWQSFLERQYRASVSLSPSARPFLIAALGNSSITVESNNINNAVPLSAGSYLQLAARTITSSGHIAAPIGRLDIGTSSPLTVLRGRVDATESVTLAAGSITSVHGGSALIPYGTTVDLAEYRFDPLRTTSLATLPTGELQIRGSSLNVTAGATVDLRGGSNVFAFEFLSGVGGSRDLLDRFNRDQFSSNDFDVAQGRGYQFADRRQVFAIVPADLAASIAAFDPIYSADYGSGGPVDVYGAKAGLTVTIDGTADVPAGEYLLLPAHYALLPGAYRVVERTGAAPLGAGETQTLLDGTVIVSGHYSYSGGDFAESERRTFSVQSPETFLKFSQIVTTTGNAYIERLSNDAQRTRPRLPIDAARVVLEPLSSLKLAGLFDTRRVAGGRGTSADIAGVNILVGPEGTATPAGTFLLTTETLSNLNAESVLIGGTRTDTSEGTTDLLARANFIRIAGTTVLELPELLLVVGGTRPDGSPVAPVISVDDGAVLRAVGSLSDPRSGDYVIDTDSLLGSTVGDATGVGAVFRLANGPERLVTRTGDAADRLTRRSALLELGAVTIDGDTLTLDTSRNITASRGATYAVDKIAISSDLVRLGLDRFDRSFLDTLAGIEQVTIRSPEAINFDAIDYRFRNLVIDAPAITLTSLTALDPAASRTLSIGAETFTWRSRFADLGGCVRAGARACGGTASNLAIDAREVAFGGGALRTYGFGGTVSFKADRVFVDGTGLLEVGDAALDFQTPVIADRAIVADPRGRSVRADYSFLTRGAVTIGGSGAAVPSAVPGNRAPGARIAFGSSDAAVASIFVDNALITASAGYVDLRSRGDITLAGTTTLAAPGFSRTFGDAFDQATVSASGGIVSLLSLAGDITLPSSSRLIADNAVGNAGTISLIAANGAIDWQALLNPAATGARAGSFTFDAAESAFDLSAFVSAYGSRFGGDITVRSGVGNLDLAAGQLVKAENVKLVADGGTIGIGGTIDTSGRSVAGLTLAASKDIAVDGGDISLFGQGGVTLSATARLDTHTSGYADRDTRVASAGDVTVGIGTLPGAAIRIESGARIDVGARRSEAAEAAGESGNRLVGEIVKDPDTLADTTVYRFVEADEGGSVRFRAPLVGAALNEVNLAGAPAAAISGASEVELEAYRRFDLNEIAASGFFSGVNDLGGTIELELVSGSSDIAVIEEGAAPNFLSYDFVAEDGTPTLVNFVRNFLVTAADGDLSGVDARPGIELVSRDNILLATNWNLAAAVIDEERAFADGLLDVITPLGGRIDWLAGTRTDQPFYAVKTGKEGELLDQARFLYRTGGSARGEAPVLNFRAGGSFTAEGSISDGLFVFRDKSDPQYIDYQLGAGSREYNIAVNFSCGVIASPSCTPLAGIDGTVAPFTGTPPGSVTAANAVNISLLTGQQGSQSTPQFVNSPFSNAANNAAAEGTNLAFENGGSYSVFAGASLEFAELFPVLPGGQTIKSSDIGIVAGAADVALPGGVSGWSADTAHVDRAVDADVVISDVRASIGLGVPTSYLVQTLGGAAAYSDDGNLQLRFARLDTGTAPPTTFTYDVDDFFAQAALSGDPFNIADVSPDAYTILNFGSGIDGVGPVAREAALAFFGERGRSFTGPVVRRTGVIAPLAEVVEFLQAFAPTYTAGVLDGSFAAALPRAQNGSNFIQRRAYVQNFVRTGGGEITLAAASDLDLRGSADTFFRRENGVLAVSASGVPLPETEANAKYGGTAVYTAGVRVAPAPVTARIVGGEKITVSLSSGAYVQSAETVDFVPSPLARSDSDGAIVHDGGDVMVSVGGDVLGRRDVYAERFADANLQRSANSAPASTANSGASDQRWRTTRIGENTEITIVPQYFTSGLGALGGGDVAIEAGGRIEELTLALSSTATTEPLGGTRALMTFGHGDLNIDARGDIAAGQFDVAHGAARIDTAGSVVSFGSEPFFRGIVRPGQSLRVRVTDATFAIAAKGSVDVASATAIDGNGAQLSAVGASNGAGNLSLLSSFSATAPGDVRINNSTVRSAVQTTTALSPTPAPNLFVLPASLGLSSLLGDVDIASFTPDGVLQIRSALQASSSGQLELLAGRDIRNLSLAMLDHDRSILPGVFSIYGGPGGEGRFFEFPGVTPSSTESDRRLQHNERITHADDSARALIIASGTIDNASINLPKQASIIAGGDVTDVYFVGQNINSGDLTRVVAGRDIRATLRTVTNPSSGANSEVPGALTIIVGGPGTLSVEAGRNLGPFAISATVASGTFGGGIRTIGNEYNPWLRPDGADVQVQFGVGNGIDYDGLESIYLNPANADDLDGDLFVQVEDVLGNMVPDRTRPIYAPILAEWLRDNAPAAFAAIFGQTFPDTPAGRAALAAAAYPKFGALYDAFTKLGEPLQRSFLVNELYFNELKQPSLPTSPSFQQFIRGYRAVEALFPARLGYTDNLAAFETDPSTINADHPLGVPRRRIVNGELQQVDRVITGSADLRLSTIQTARGGDITILAPGGDLVAGSVLRTSEQARVRATPFGGVDIENGFLIQPFDENVRSTQSLQPIRSIPLGFEGILTLRGGAVRSFSDGDLRLNQSRLFTQAGGDIVAWSSNGDLNAGQGPRSASSFSPLAVRFDLNGFPEIDRTASVSGGGIGAFKQTPEQPSSSVILIAPVGEVDAGDAGVRASGDIFVAAARVANAENFSAGGDISGVPLASAVAAPPVPTSAASAIVAQVARLSDSNAGADPRSLIIVDVLGFAGGDVCDDPNNTDPNCPR